MLLALALNVGQVKRQLKTDFYFILAFWKYRLTPDLKLARTKDF